MSAYEKYRRWCEERGLKPADESKWITLRDSVFKWGAKQPKK